jgi:hypothetical protein
MIFAISFSLPLGSPFRWLVIITRRWPTVWGAGIAKVNQNGGLLQVIAPEAGYQPSRSPGAAVRWRVGEEAEERQADALRHFLHAKPDLLAGGETGSPPNVEQFVEAANSTEPVGPFAEVADQCR